MENLKFAEILKILKANDKIPLADIAESVGEPPKEVFKCIVLIINERLCPGKIVGGLNGIFVAETFILNQGAGPVEKGINLSVKSGGTLNWLNADHGARVEDVAFARDAITNDIRERIEPFDVKIPPELLANLQALAVSCHRNEDTRVGVIDEIDSLDEEKGTLRRKVRKTEEEQNRLQNISTQLQNLNERLGIIDVKLIENYDQLKNSISVATANSVDSIIIQLEKQNAKLAASLTSSNRDFLQLLENLSVSLSAKFEVQKEDIEKISKLIDLPEQHLTGLVSALDGQPDDRRLTFKNELIAMAKSAVVEVANNPTEVVETMNKIFDQQIETKSRLNALKSFLAKSKIWVSNNPKTVLLLRMLIFGALTGAGYQIPKI